MKISNLFNPKFLFIEILVLFIVWGCRDTLIEPVNDSLLVEKSGVNEVVLPTGTLDGGALYEIALPLPYWNDLDQRVMLVYAHGYEDADQELELPSDSIEGVAIKDFILSKGMGYATTSYRENGLAVVEGVQDIILLREKIFQFFAANPQFMPANYIVLVGPSEGGLVTVLTIEQFPGYFHAAIATCCPIGDFYKQIQYYGDAHVLFKYFFGPSLNGINLGSPKRISKATVKAWNDKLLQEAIIETLKDDYLTNDGNKVRQFVECANIPVDISNPERTIQVILEVMHYPIKATNDALSRIGGNPYNNKSPMKIYSGSDNDRKLNLTIERIKRSDYETAANNVALMFETSGELYTPLITLHKLNDHITFYEHQTVYTDKVNDNSPFPQLLIHIPIPGDCAHCTFQLVDIEQALMVLNEML